MSSLLPNIPYSFIDWTALCHAYTSYYAHCTSYTVKPVYNDHLYNKIYYLCLIQ